MGTMLHSTPLHVQCQLQEVVWEVPRRVFKNSAAGTTTLHNLHIQQL